MTNAFRPSSRAPSYVVRGPVDLIAIAPVVLGFVPTESVVLASFGGPAGSFHARVDLPESRAEQHGVAAMLLEAAVLNNVEVAAVLVFSELHIRARRQGRILLSSLREAGIDVLEVLRVGAERYHRLIGDDATGTAYDISAHPFVAQRVFEGEVVHASREELVASLAPLDDAPMLCAVRTAVDATSAHGLSADELGAEASWIQSRIRRFRRTRAALDAADAGRVLALVSSADLRDVAWAEMERADGDAHVVLWRDLLRRAPDSLAGDAAALLAFAAWLHGDGALAWCAIDRVDGDASPAAHQLAEQVARVLTAALPPTTWHPPRAGVFSAR